MLSNVAARTGLVGVREFHIPSTVLDRTIAILAEAGRRGCEAFVVWSGVLAEHGRVMRFTSAEHPEQQATRHPRGLLVTVGGDALFRVNKRVHERGEILAGQVHTHPGRAYHSDTDDHYPLVTLVGALSVVVPDFARAGRAGMNAWARYRLAGPAKWEPFRPDDRIVVVP